VTGIATVVCLVLAVGVLAVAGWRAYRDREVERIELLLTGVLEIAVLVYLGFRVADLVGGHHPPSLGILVVYLVGTALLMPVATAFALAERSRWGPVVLAFGALVLCVLFARIDQLWTTRG
jgi:hypothetical protein